MSTSPMERLEQLLLEGKIDAQDFVHIARGLRESPVSEVPPEDDRTSLTAGHPKQRTFTLLTSLRAALLNAGAQLGMLLAIPLVLGVLFSGSSLSVQNFLLTLVYCSMTVLAAQVLAIPAAAVFHLLFRQFAVAPRYVYVVASWVMLVLLLPSLAASD